MLMDLDALKNLFSEGVIEAALDKGQAVAKVKPSYLHQVLKVCKEDPRFKFNFLMDVIGVDYLGEVPRFEVVYHLHSIEQKQRIRLKARLHGADPVIESVTSVWRGANWYEREVFDLFGIKFLQHPDLRRIMMPDDWEGHPLRKDYPITGTRI